MSVVEDSSEIPEFEINKSNFIQFVDISPDDISYELVLNKLKQLKLLNKKILAVIILC